jgi:hypothetical protein
MFRTGGGKRQRPSGGRREPELGGGWSAAPEDARLAARNRPRRRSQPDRAAGVLGGAGGAPDGFHGVPARSAALATRRT